MGARICSTVASAALSLLVLLAVAEAAAARHRGVTSKYRRKHQASDDMPLDADVFAVPPGQNAPQQVHISLGDQTGTAMTVSWVTLDVTHSTVWYGRAMDQLDLTAEGDFTRYSYHNYTSGFIHHATLRNLEYATKYYYAVGSGGDAVRTFWFTTPPEPSPDGPIRFGLIGDLGQTPDSNSTLTHYEQHPGDTVIFVGDLSYADKHPLHDNNRWDTWGRFAERSMAYQPWILTAGNHEIDYAWSSERACRSSPSPTATRRRIGPATPGTPAGTPSRWARRTSSFSPPTPPSPSTRRSTSGWRRSSSASTAPRRPGSSSTPTRRGTTATTSTTWRASPCGCSLSRWSSTPVADRRAPVYITIGDGGNVEGLADELTWPQPAYSAFREYSYGHAVLDIKNRTHAYYAWYRNHEGNKVAADTMWFTNRYHMPNHDESLSSIAYA